jgi:tRNA A58 N-methylase Trm61
MINITFPDGNVRQYEKGTSALEIAQSISHGLAKNVLSAKVNGEVWDATRPINEDADRAIADLERPTGENDVLALFCPPDGRSIGGIISRN